MNNRLHGMVAAFWDGSMATDTAEPWATMRTGLAGYQNDRAANIVVINEPKDLPQGKLTRDLGLATVLGYVHLRASSYGSLLPWAEVQQQIDAYASPGGGPFLIDGVYLDEAVVPNDLTGAQGIVELFRAEPAYAALKIMILAGGCPDEWVVNGFTSPITGHHIAAPDWALLWEDTTYAYRESFSAQKIGPPAHPGDPVDPSDTYAVTMPSWWKNPQYRQQIAHTVHGTATDYDWQDVTGRAIERNVGHLFVMDWRGAKPADPRQVHNQYDHLPPYWTSQSPWADSYNDHAVGLTDAELIWAARQLAPDHQAAHAWPNFEQAWPGGHQVRGTCFVTDETGVTVVEIPVAALQGPEGGPPPVWDVSSVWGAVHRWAVAQDDLITAMPTFKPVGPDSVEVVSFASTIDWLTPTTIATTAAPPRVNESTTAPQPVDWPVVEGRYTFAEAGAVIRSVSRAAGKSGKTGWPTFNANLQGVRADPSPGDPLGRMTRSGLSGYEALVVDAAAPVIVVDVPGEEYGAKIA